MTDQEIKVFELLAETWNAFVELPVQHGSDRQEFLYSIHALQNIVAYRQTARINPKLFRIENDNTIEKTKLKSTEG